VNADSHEPIDDMTQLRRGIISAGKVLQRAVAGQRDLSAEEWERFGELLDALDSALTSMDADVIKSTAIGIEGLAEPRRVIKLGSAGSKSPMPEPIRDRLNVIVHKIDRLAAEVAAVNEAPPPAEPERG
jgi:hypothetical protein